MDTGMKRKAEKGISLSRDSEERNDAGFKGKVCGWRWRTEAAYQRRGEVQE